MNRPHPLLPLLIVALFSAGVPALLPAQPVETGQGAFAALAEIATMLSEDPNTDWQRVDLLALREHLIDMDVVTLNAEVEEQTIDNGVEVEIRGQGRTLEALQRMIPMHLHAIAEEAPWQVAVEHLEDGFVLQLTADDPGEAARLRGLGFFGFLALGNHHQQHHLALATGALDHQGHGMAQHQH